MRTIDLFYSHIAGMDAFANGLKIAYNIIQDGKLDKLISDRYASFRTGIGEDILDGKIGFNELEKCAIFNDQIKNISGKQEMLEAILNNYIFIS